MTTSDGRRRSKHEHRHAAILQRLRESGAATVDILCAELGVSVHTVRRDLDELHELGALRRIRGGAAQLEPMFYEPFRADVSFQEQVESFADEKRRIAKAAGAMVNDGDIVAMTAGTTTTETVRCLPMNRGLTVVTNTVNVAMELCKRRDLEVFVTGGNLRGTWFSLVGPRAIQSICRVSIDTLFIGVNGLDCARGLTCFNPDEADVNEAMVRQARRKIVVADHSKFGVVGKWLIAPTTAIDTIVTGHEADDAQVNLFRKQGISVILV